MVKVELIFQTGDTVEEVISTMEHAPEVGDIFNWKGERWQVYDFEDWAEGDVTVWLTKADDNSVYLNK